MAVGVVGWANDCIVALDVMGKAFCLENETWNVVSVNVDVPGGWAPLRVSALVLVGNILVNYFVDVVLRYTGGGSLAMAIVGDHNVLGHMNLDDSHVMNDVRVVVEAYGQVAGDDSPVIANTNADDSLEGNASNGRIDDSNYIFQNDCEANVRVVNVSQN